jgi:hypothetical protein
MRRGTRRLAGASRTSAPRRDHTNNSSYRLPLSRCRILPVVFVLAIFEDEERFAAMCGCFGDRDGFSEAFERERLALRDVQHFISDETANLG